MNKGFTLVELSIVLVIIGLLTGGILVGQSMLDTVKTLRFTRDLAQYQAAVNLFRMNFKSYPGDSTLFTPAGDADGYIDSSGVCNGAYSGDESFQVFAHLSGSEMLKTNYVAYSPTSCLGGTHPTSANSPTLAGVAWPYTELEDAGADLFGSPRPPIHAYKPDATPSIFYFNFWLSPKQMYSIVGKLGDINATPNYGIITSGGLQIQACYDETWDPSFPCRSDAIVLVQLSFSGDGF